MTGEKLPRETVALLRAKGNIRDEVLAGMLNMRVRKLRRIMSGRGRVSQHLLDKLIYEGICSLGLRFAMNDVLGGTDMDVIAEMIKRLKIARDTKDK